MKTVIAAITFLIALSAFAASENADVVLERLKHPASVCVMGDPCSENLGKAPVAAAARTGDQVFNGAWAARVDQGMETLVKHAIEGYNAMPARGLCADCSDQEIADAVAYMVDGL
jgi:cytochrome c5